MTQNKADNSASETEGEDEKRTGLDWWKHEARELAMTIAVFLPIWVVFTSFVYELRSIPSESMVPALQVGDRVAVSKFAYGYSRYTPVLGVGQWFSSEDKSKPDQRMFASMPERGDVIVFRHPNTNRVMIKRLIGMPGDQLQVVAGVVHLNGEPIVRDFVRRVRYVKHNERIPTNVVEFRETLPNGVSYLVYEESGKTELDNTPVFEIPEGHVFMMGDNRDNSEDSRSPRGHIELYRQNPTGWNGLIFQGVGSTPTAIGYVPLDHLMGRAETVAFTLYRCRKQADTECAKGRVWKGL